MPAIIIFSTLKPLFISNWLPFKYVLHDIPTIIILSVYMNVILSGYSLLKKGKKMYKGLNVYLSFNYW